MGNELNQNEIEMIKLVLKKYTLDKKYKYMNITRIFLYLAKISLLNPKAKGKLKYN